MHGGCDFPSFHRQFSCEYTCRFCMHIQIMIKSIEMIINSMKTVDKETVAHVVHVLNLAATQTWTVT